MEYLSNQYDGILHTPDLSLVEEVNLQDGTEVVQVKSSRTLINEKYDRARANGQVISLGSTTTRSSIQSTFTSISSTVSAMRSKRTEREVTIKKNSAMISYEATRMVLTTNSDGLKVYVVAPGESSNSRKVKVSMHPFAQGKCVNQIIAIGRLLISTNIFLS